MEKVTRKREDRFTEKDLFAFFKEAIIYVDEGRAELQRLFEAKMENYAVDRQITR